MPELSRFFGIIIRMYFEPAAKHQHHIPHFHAYYQDAVGYILLTLWSLLLVLCPENNRDWLKRELSCIKQNYCKIGKDYGLVKLLLKSIH